LDGGTGVMLKAQSDIMATKANFNAGLSREALISQCEANTYFDILSDETKNDLITAPLEDLRKACGL